MSRPKAPRRDEVVGSLLADVVSDARSNSVSCGDLRIHAGALVDRALLHRVTGPLRMALERCDMPVDDTLIRHQESDAVARLTALHDLCFLTGVFDELGIDVLAFKGQVLTTLVGRDEWERPTCDLDLLVRPEDLERAVNALVDRGVILLDRNWQLMLDWMIGEMHLILPAGTSLDLHWHLLVKQSMRGDFAPDHSQLFDTSRVIELDGVAVRTFGTAETLVYSCLHAAISGGHRLVWLKDIERLVTYDVSDWEAVFRVAEAWKCSLIVGLLLQRTQTTLGLELPAGTIERLVPSKLIRRIYAWIDSARPVAENEHDESMLRLFTRSIGPSGVATLIRFATRSVTFARRRTLHRDFDDPLELLVDLPGNDARSQYFGRVGNAEPDPIGFAGESENQRPPRA